MTTYTYPEHWHPNLPKPADGCECPCHTTAGMVHFVACCGPGSMMGPYKRERKGEVPHAR